MVRERPLRAANGFVALIVILALAALAGVKLLGAVQEGAPGQAIAWIVLLALAFTCLPGVFVVNPNDARVLTLFGKYIGTVKEAGFWFANPFAVKRRISLRVRNFETAKLKVNDAHSNPIEIAAIVVWKVVETAEAMFEVDDYEDYVRMQSESALRALASSYPYDAHDAGAVALSTHTAEVSKGLLEALHERLGKAGVEVHRVAHQPPGLLARDRLGDAAAAAGERHHRGALQDRRGRGGHGGERAGAARRRRASCTWTRSARRPW